ncbi:MAG: DUF3800 domain-containing protein [Candidatus Berkelbacteria bacterium]|nr:DUF3800 domain-containing protein [Candidatus Berkelbacteria bacterium]MCR4308258.1 DUF3800 domain-containing protein [Candidatus Berkelbacteria bacterium]
MSYIFLDESGDLGFKKRSSKWFVFTVVLANDPKHLERAVNRTWRPLKKKHRSVGKLHATKEKDVTRKRLLTSIGKIEDLQILSIALDKSKVHIDLQSQKHFLYNYTANLLLELLYSQKVVDGGEVIELFVDRKDTKKELQENFVRYLMDSFGKMGKGEVSITLHTSHQNKSLQAVDFVAWAVFQKYERKITKFYDLVESKIVVERLVYPE